MRFKTYLKKHHKFIVSNLLIGLLFLLCIYFLFFDLTYAWYIKYGILPSEISWLKSQFACMAFVRKNALKLAEESFGVFFTIITIVFSLGTSIFSRSEHKVFGISCQDLQADESFMLKFFCKAGFFYPLIIVFAILLDFCGTSYMMLLCNYLLVYFNFRSLKKSYNKQWQREEVVTKLLANVECEKNSIDNNMMDYDTMLEDIRRSILEKEGWNNAWQLFDVFLERIKEYDNEKYFVLLCHFWEIIFSVGSEQSVREQMTYVKKYISRMEIPESNYSKENIILWSLLCSIALQWDRTTMIGFLEWFANISVRSSQRVLMRLDFLPISEIQRQSGIILFMLEYWLNMNDEDVYIGSECIDRVYNFGKAFLGNKNIKHEVEELMRILADLLEDRCGIEKDKIYDIFNTLWMDINFGFNNSLLVTKLKYELWESQ